MVEKRNGWLNDMDVIADVSTGQMTIGCHKPIDIREELYNDLVKIRLLSPEDFVPWGYGNSVHRCIRDSSLLCDYERFKKSVFFPKYIDLTHKFVFYDSNAYMCELSDIVKKYHNMNFILGGQTSTPINIMINADNIDKILYLIKHVDFMSIGPNSNLIPGGCVIVKSFYSISQIGKEKIDELIKLGKSKKFYRFSLETAEFTDVGPHDPLFCVKENKVIYNKGFSSSYATK